MLSRPTFSHAQKSLQFSDATADFPPKVKLAPKEAKKLRSTSNQCVSRLYGDHFRRTFNKQTSIFQDQREKMAQTQKLSEQVSKNQNHVKNEKSEFKAKKK